MGEAFITTSDAGRLCYFCFVFATSIIQWAKGTIAAQ
jgi:hypothetical protein